MQGQIKRIIFGILVCLAVNCADGVEAKELRRRIERELENVSLEEDSLAAGKFCKPGACFSGAKCNEEDGSCTCEEGKIFTGSRCEDTQCILDDIYEEKCLCPLLMVRNGTECVPRIGKTCDKNCGLGLCVNDNKCRCFKGAELLNKICVLKKSVCASGKLANGSNSQCQCDNKYKQAKDGKTCQLVTCDDESAKNFCAQRGATCTMKWTASPPQFDCLCPKGYVMDNDRDICTAINTGDYNTSTFEPTSWNIFDASTTYHPLSTSKEFQSTPERKPERTTIAPSTEFERTTAPTATESSTENTRVTTTSPTLKLIKSLVVKILIYDEKIQ